MVAPDHIDSLPSRSDDLSAEDMLVMILKEMDNVKRVLGEQADEISRLREQVRRPERVRYYEKDLRKRLGVSRATIYRLWSEGLLDYHQDRLPNQSGLGSRYSTELDVERYEKKSVHSP